jgi:hypothetical protein
MQLFECGFCRQPLYFENDHCESCGHRLGYVPETMELVPLEAGDGAFVVPGAPERRYRFCANATHDVCNWLIATGEREDFCLACRHNRTIPALTTPENRRLWRLVEQAKHRLFYTLIELHLPLRNRAEDPVEGLVFDFLDPQNARKVLTGHERGLITLNIAEADDAERERRRHSMGEAYRTLLGHFRHEIGHYYWDRLVRDRPAMRGRFREVFGDERVDYEAALQTHYAEGAPPDWRERFVTAYASSHPWEDFAETWAHYLHIVDTLETATAFGLSLHPRIARGEELSADVDFDPSRNNTIGSLMKAWLPLTFAVNSLNRGMGQPDLYPFVLSPVVVGKLGFIHDLVHGSLVPHGEEHSEFQPAMLDPEPSPA